MWSELEQVEQEVDRLRAALLAAEQRLDALRGYTRCERAKRRGRELVGELVNRREELDWSIKKLAKLMGCGNDNVAKREAGLVWPMQAVVSSWCQVLGGRLWLVEQGSGRRQELAGGPCEVAAQLARLREQREWSQAELAQRMGVSSVLVGQREAGLASVHGQRLHVLLEWVHTLGYELELVLV